MAQVTEQRLIEDLVAFQDSEGHENGGKIIKRISRQIYYGEMSLPDQPVFGQPRQASASKEREEAKRLCAQLTLSHG